MLARGRPSALSHGQLCLSIQRVAVIVGGGEESGMCLAKPHWQLRQGRSTPPQDDLPSRAEGNDGRPVLQSVVAAHTSEVWVGRPSPEV